MSADPSTDNASTGSPILTLGFQREYSRLKFLSHPDDHNKLRRPPHSWPTEWLELVGVGNMLEIDKDFQDIYCEGGQSRTLMKKALAKNPKLVRAVRLLNYLERRNIGNKYEKKPMRTIESENARVECCEWLFCVCRGLSHIVAFALCLLPCLLMCVCELAERTCSCSDEDDQFSNDLTIRSKHANWSDAAVVLMTRKRMHELMLKYDARLHKCDVRYIEKKVFHPETTALDSNDQQYVVPAHWGMEYLLCFYRRGFGPVQETPDFACVESGVVTTVTEVDGGESISLVEHKEQDGTDYVEMMTAVGSEPMMDRCSVDRV